MPRTSKENKINYTDPYKEMTGEAWVTYLVKDGDFKEDLGNRKETEV